MRKSDLKSGMGVELNNGGLYMVVIGEEFSILTGDGYMNLAGYNEDLTYHRSVNFDIKKVFNPENIYSMQPKHFSSDFYNWFNLIWSRKSNQYKVGDYVKWVGEAGMSYTKDGVVYEVIEPANGNDSQLWGKMTEEMCHWEVGSPVCLLNSKDDSNASKIVKLTEEEVVEFKEEQKYKDLEVGDICEVWDDTDEDDKVLTYYIGDKEFVSTKSYLCSDDDFYREYYDNFKLIKKASDID